MRCFVAVELDRPLRDPLLKLLREQLPRTRDVRWCTEQQLHLTLKFLGEVPDNQLPAVCDAAAAAARVIEPFSLRLGGLGCFPPRGSPRVLWCGVDDVARGCARWLAAADPLFEELGFPRERREFHPHITLGRSKNASGGSIIRRVLDNAAAPPPRHMTVAELVLFESRLSPAGAQYAAQFRAPVGQ